MTELEWEKYVSKIARKVKVCMGFDPAFNSRPNTKTYRKERQVKEKVVKSRKVRELMPAPKLKYIVKEYLFRGKIYKKKWLIIDNGGNVADK